MAEVVIMPKLGFDMAEGTLVRWVKTEGQAIEKGEVLAEIETDKATVEVESRASGIVHKHLVGENSIVPVGAPIAVIGEQGEDFDLERLLLEVPGELALETTSSSPAPAAAPPAGPVASTAQTLPEAPPLADAPFSDGKSRGRQKASPLARRLAQEHGIELGLLRGSGPGGRIVKRDVEAALSAPPAAVGLPPLELVTGAPRPAQPIPLSRLRKAIGRRMTASKQQLPHFYLTADLDAGPLMALRRQYNALLADDEKISVNDFIVKAAALALRQFPNLNASLGEDQILQHANINIGIAVAVEDGLLTVVVSDADRKPLRQISGETRQMVARAREGKVRPEDVEGSTFTISNLGMLDVDHFIAIINPPEAAILAIGSVLKVPVVIDDQVVIGQRLKVTLSADHRVTDGAEAARWLQVFRGMIENPLPLILG